MNYNGKIFKPIVTSETSEISINTIFKYQQNGTILTCDYSGDTIKKGHLIGVVKQDDTIEMCYHQVNHNDILMTGNCISKPEILSNGKIRLHEKWKWTSGDKSEGESIIEEQ
jgi:hypothetical protein